MYVHCMGGHGRTGTVMISLLAAVEGNDARSSHEQFCRRHASRRGCNGLCSHKLPEDESQKIQLRATAPSMKRQHRIHAHGGLRLRVGGTDMHEEEMGHEIWGELVFSLCVKGVFVLGRQLDDTRRFALCWVGGGTVEGDDALWNFIR